MWDRVRTAMMAELEKIAEFALDGLSPANALAASQPPPPMPSAAYDKAMATLDRKDQLEGTVTKEAANLQFSGAVLDNRPKKESDSPQAVRDAKSVGAHVLGGGGAGRLVSEMAFGPKHLPDPKKLHGAKWYGTAAGAAIGAAEYGRKKLQAHRQMKKQAMTPKLQLKAAKQVGSVSASPSIHKTPSSSAQTPGKIGRKFAP